MAGSTLAQAFISSPFPHNMLAAMADIAASMSSVVSACANLIRSSNEMPMPSPINLLRALVKHADTEFRSVFCGQFHRLTSGRWSRSSATVNQHGELHRFVPHLSFCPISDPVRHRTLVQRNLKR